MPTPTPQERLEAIRTEIRAERVSQGELIELQGLAAHIEPGDVELLEWAGVPEGLTGQAWSRMTDAQQDDYLANV